MWGYPVLLLFTGPVDLNFQNARPVAPSAPSSADNVSLESSFGQQRRDAQQAAEVERNRRKKAEVELFDRLATERHRVAWCCLG